MISIQQITSEEVRDKSIKYMSRYARDMMIVACNSEYQSYPIIAASYNLDDLNLKTHVAQFKDKTVAFFRNTNVFHLRNFTGFICLDASNKLMESAAYPIFYICECIEKAISEGYYAYYSINNVIYRDPCERLTEEESDIS